MPAANESQGLKIAVAAFVSLAVVLAVTTYFMYSNYSQASADLADAQGKLNTAKKEAEESSRFALEVRKQAGLEKFEEIEAFKGELKKQNDKWTEELRGLKTKLADVVKAAQDRGANDQDVARFNTEADQAIDQVLNEPNASLTLKIDRMIDVVRNNLAVMEAVVADNIGLRTSLEGVNAADQAKIEEAEKALAAANTKFVGEIGKLESDRRADIAVKDEYLSRNRALLDQLDKLKRDLEGRTLAWNNEKRNLLAQIQTQRQKLNLNSDQLNVPPGYDIRITFVDYTRFEARTNLTRAMGARPLMSFSVFNRAATNLPSDRPKARIQLIQVGENDSVARILPSQYGIRQTVPEDPIREGDIVFSPAFMPYDPQQFAFIGKIDMNRDGQDDRANVRRLIEAAGGRVVFDLPEPGDGQPSGQLTPQINYYVTDDRPSDSAGGRQASKELTPEYRSFLDRKNNALKQASLLGIGAMPLSRLLTYLGYSPGLNLPGRVEAIDRGVSSEVQRPRELPSAPTAPRVEPPKRQAAPRRQATPKEEAPAPEEGGEPAEGGEG